MTKKKSTKRTLLMSGLALLVCISMLIGSTFAWFTDNVTSAGNIIKSGTLDVEMYWADGKEAPDTAVWTDASTGAIFNYEKWDPGFVQVRHIKIENIGNLALKYQLSILANGEVTDLADVIDVYYVDPATQVSNRAALTANMKLGSLTEVLAGFNSTASGNLEAGKNHTVTIALKMREEAGNEYQDKGIGADFSVILTATQLDFENDSFGKDYDASATLPEVGVATVKENSGATTIDVGNVSVTLPAGVPTGEYKVVVSNEKATTDANEQTTYTADINLLKDGVKVERNGNTVYVVTIELEVDKSILKVLHKGVEVTDYEYNSETGILEFETDSFSPFAVVYEKNKTVKVTSSEEFVNALTTAEAGAVIDAAGLTIDINEIGSDLPVGKRAISISGGITIKNLTAVGTYRGGNALYYQGPADEEIVFENCSFELSGMSMALDLMTAKDGVASVVYNNCAFKGAIVLEILSEDGVATYNNCTFTKHPSRGQGYVMVVGGTHLFNDCTFDYTGVTQTNSGVINTASVNAVSESDGSNTTVVVLDGCTRINCGTRKYGADSTLTIK